MVKKQTDPDTSRKKGRDKRSGSYTTRVSLTDPDTGQRTQKRLTARTQKELDAKIVDLKDRWYKGTYTEPDTTKLGDYLTAWLAGLQRAQTTRYQYGVTIKNHFLPDPIAAVPLGKLKRAHVQDFLDRKAAAGYAPATIHALHALLTGALKRAVKLGTLTTNPASGLDLPPIPHAAPNVWSQEDTRAFLAAVADRDDAALWTLAVVLGLRQGELLALGWDDVDLAHGTLAVRRTLTRDTAGRWVVGDVPKTESGNRTIQLPTRCRDALKAQRTHQLERRLTAGALWQDTGAVFDRGDGGRISRPSTVAHRFGRIVQRAGLPAITPHGLRHTAATNMLKNGVPVHVVAHILGHRDPSITLKVYAHALSDAQADAVARIDAMLA